MNTRSPVGALSRAVEQVFPKYRERVTKRHSRPRTAESNAEAKS